MENQCDLWHGEIQTERIKYEEIKSGDILMFTNRRKRIYVTISEEEGRTTLVFYRIMSGSPEIAVMSVRSTILKAIFSCIKRKRWPGKEKNIHDMARGTVDRIVRSQKKRVLDALYPTAFFTYVEREQETTPTRAVAREAKA